VLNWQVFICIFSGGYEALTPESAERIALLGLFQAKQFSSDSTHLLDYIF